MWCKSRRLLSKLQHTLNGNTAGKHRTWSSRHHTVPGHSLTFGCLNCGGLQDKPKRQSIAALDLDILVLTETHLQSHMLAAEADKFPDYYCLWGFAPNDRHFAGVAVFAKRSSFWAAKSLQWAQDNEFVSFCHDGRALVAQLWLGNGGASIFVYACYGQSGGRSDRVKKTYMHNLVSALSRDLIARGQVPAIFTGDINLELSDSKLLSDLLHSGIWFDLRQCADEQMQSRNTCHQGQGSKIDHLFVFRRLYDQCFDFEIKRVHPFKDHSCVSAKMIAPTCSQKGKTLRQGQVYTELSFPESGDRLYEPLLSNSFAQPLQQQDVTRAFTLWSYEAERILMAKVKSSFMSSVGILKLSWVTLRP